MLHASVVDKGPNFVCRKFKISVFVEQELKKPMY